MNKPLRILAFGDVHMGHSTTPADKIFDEIKECFPIGNWASTVDILVLDGDFWDKLLPNNHADVYVAKQAIIYLLNWCKLHDVLLLLVDGTPLHDAGQMQWFGMLNEQANIHADMVFAEDISIVYISKFDINVLFIPDRPRSKPEDTFKRVEELLEEKELTQVDLAVMHGCFQYQIPEISAEHKHVEENYFKVVKGPILIGHIHTHSSLKSIIAPGSFSRLKHGEEEKKGFIDLTMDTDGTFKAKFIENKNATIYKTIKVYNMELEDALGKINDTISKLPTYSRIRIECDKNSPLTVDKTFLALKQTYPDVLFTLLVKTDKSVVASNKEVFQQEETYTPLVLNRNNLVEVIMEKVASIGAEHHVIDKIPQFLKEVM